MWPQGTNHRPLPHSGRSARAHGKLSLIPFQRRRTEQRALTWRMDNRYGRDRHYLIVDILPKWEYTTEELPILQLFPIARR